MIFTKEEKKILAEGFECLYSGYFPGQFEIIAKNYDAESQDPKDKYAVAAAFFYRMESEIENNQDAQFRCACDFSNGWGVEKNNNLAIEIMKDLSDKDYIDATIFLAKTYLYETEFINRNLAEYYLKKAHAQILEQDSSKTSILDDLFLDLDDI